MKIVCLGDSITWGAWDSEGGWVSRLRRRIDQKWIASELDEMVLVYNCGISSDTTRDVLNRLPEYIKALAIEEHEFAFVISLGTNDAIWDKSTEQFWVPMNEYTDNLAKIVRIASEHSQKVLLLGSLPVDELMIRAHGGDTVIETTNKRIEAYEGAMESVAVSEGVDFVPLFNSLNGKPVKDFVFRDGDHPNDAGHQHIENAVWPVVSRWIEPLTN